MVQNYIILYVPNTTHKINISFEVTGKWKGKGIKGKWRVITVLFVVND